MEGGVDPELWRQGEGDCCASDMDDLEGSDVSGLQLGARVGREAKILGAE